ncbi:hypothetical protein PC112_g16948 [Phytophthora cactorum]|nr:hypothetical protein PC112_g16948 [Phytophthora cactorum]
MDLAFAVENKAGVAILIDPYGVFKDARLRKTFFSELLDRDVPTGRLVSLGGDYNSTQDATIGRDPSLRGIRASSQRGKFELKNWPVR